MDIDVVVYEENPSASVSNKVEQVQDALASDMGNSSTATSSSITPQSIDMNNIDGSGSDFSYHDDEDGDADDYCDYDDYDNFSYTDEYAILQSRLDNVHLPPGVEASLPWLKDPSPSGTIPSTKNSTVSGPPSTKGTEVGSCSSITQADSNSSNQGGDNDDTVMEKFQSFKQFDMVDDFSDHHYKRVGYFEKQPPKSWTKRVQEEWKILEKDLPETIFVRVYESRMDLLRAVIVGPAGTPYHDGLFGFDCLFPAEYPTLPPMVYYYSGGLRLNPNLYECGKVCLSLLGTWRGHQNENWVAGKSTMLQVLVSIQALILNAKPFFNEPGYENTFTGSVGESKSNEYNEGVYILSLKIMTYTLRKPPKHFEDLVAGHFRKRAHDILLACKAYMEGALVGSNVKDEAKESRVSGEFKANVAIMMNELMTSFTRNGSSDCDQFLSPGTNPTIKQ